MALISTVATTILLALALTHFNLSTGHLLKGSVACIDCTPHHDLSGVRVEAKCRNHKMVSAVTNEEGYFELKVPMSTSLPSAQSPDCLATLLGGPEQLCAYKKSMVSRIVKARASSFYTLSTPLAFFTSCPSDVDHPKPGDEMVGNGKSSELTTSETYGPFLPGGLAMPPINYFRFMPIIGIP